MRVGVIGAGVVGSTMAIKLKEKGYNVEAIASRGAEKAFALATAVGAKVLTIAELIVASDLILIATPDSAIGPLVGEFASQFREGQVLVHFSGSLSSDIMTLGRQHGAKVLSLHPLQSFANTKVALATLEGAHFAIEGEDLELGAKLVSDLGGVPHLINGKLKSLYHAGACIASNYLVVLADLAAELLSRAGFVREEALSCLLPLMQGSLTNLERVGIPAALTGPVARGDWQVVEEHLSNLPQAVIPIYSHLGLQAAHIAVAKGTLNEENNARLEKLLSAHTSLATSLNENGEGKENETI